MRLIIKIPHGGIVITKLKKTLFLSTGLLFIGGTALDCSAETATASDVLSGLLTTAADVVSSTQTATNQQQPQSTAQPSTQASTVQTSPVAESDNETKLPSFDDLIKDESPKKDVTAQAVQNSSPVAQAAGTSALPVAPALTTDGNVAQFANPQSAPATVPQAVQPEKTTQDVAPITGFVAQDGTVFNAPTDMTFPAEMQEGMYFFSRDVNKLKQELSERRQRGQFGPQGGRQQNGFPNRMNNGNGYPGPGGQAPFAQNNQNNWNQQGRNGPGQGTSQFGMPQHPGGMNGPRGAGQIGPNGSGTNGSVPNGFEHPENGSQLPGFDNPQSWRTQPGDNANSFQQNADGVGGQNFTNAGPQMNPYQDGRSTGQIPGNGGGPQWDRQNMWQKNGEVAAQNNGNFTTNLQGNIPHGPGQNGPGQNGNSPQFPQGNDKKPITFQCYLA